MQRIALVAAIVVVASACDGARDLAWELRFEPAALAEDAAVVRAEVLLGGCVGTEVVWGAEIRRDRIRRMAVPDLGPGTYGFAGVATDGSCRIVARGCEELELPADDARVVTVLRSAGVPEPQCEASECVGGVCGADAGPPGIDAGPLPDAGPIDAGPPPPDVGPPDAGPIVDPDAGPPDGGPPPVDAGPPPDPLVQISGYLSHACALYESGRVRCWGLNGDMQLGDGTVMTRTSPVAVPLVDDAIALGIGPDARHTCVVRRTGRVACWGENAQGQLGIGAAGGDRGMPSDMSGITEAVGVSVGFRHTCVLTSAGEVYCAGDNSEGQIGDGSTSDATTARRVVLPSPATRVASGQDHSCALVPGDGVFCWGNNDYAQVDGSRISPRRTPRMSTISDVEVATGSEHSCAVNSANDLYCWGNNESAQIGDGTASATRDAPTRALAAGDDVDRVVAGGYNDPADALDAAHSCVRRRVDGEVRCWGANNVGQLGDGTTTTRGTGVRPMGLGGVDWLTTGARFTCVLTGGVASCWGSNTNGQLGDGTMVNRLVPTPVVGL